MKKMQTLLVHGPELKLSVPLCLETEPFTRPMSTLRGALSPAPAGQAEISPSLAA